MIIVRVELHSAVTHRVTELARMKICNDGTGTNTLRNYDAVTFRGRDKDTLDKESVNRHARLERHPSNAVHVWSLVSKILQALKY